MPRIKCFSNGKIDARGDITLASMVSIISVVFGATIAHVADRFPAHSEALETGAGILLIGGLVLLGSALPAIP